MVVDSDDKVLLARVDERTKNTAEDIAEIKNALKGMDDKFVTKASFEPVRAIVFGGVALVLIAVLGLVINGNIGVPRL